MNRPCDTNDRTDRSQNLPPDRVTRLHAGNREPGVEARLLFPGWGPTLWEVATPESEPRERRYGDG